MIRKINFNLSEFSLSDVATWPLTIKVLMVSMSILLLSMGMYFYDLQPQLTEFSVFYNEMLHLQHTLNEQKQLLNQKTNLEEKLKVVQQKWLSTIQQISNSNQIADLLTDISRIGMKNKLEYKSIRPLAQQSQNMLTVLPVEISVEGECSQLINFLSQLASFRKGVNLQDFKITKINNFSDAPGSQANKFILVVLVNIYLRFQDENILTNNNGSEMQVKNSMNQPSKILDSYNHQTLSALDVEKLKMVGYLQQGIKQWALLATPNEEVYHVTNGTILGVQQGKIIKITQNKVELVITDQGLTKTLMLHMHK